MPNLTSVGITNGVPTSGTGTVSTIDGLIAAGIAVNSQGYSANPTVTRPNDTTAYAAGDVVGGAITFANMAPAAGGEIMITSAMLRINDSALISGESSYRLHLYNVTPPSAIADNSPFDLPSGDRASYLGYVDLGIPVDLGSTLYVKTDGINAQIKAASGTIYGYLVTTAAYTPSAQRVYVPELHATAV